MEILQPQPSDLIEIVYLQKVCFSEMKSKGWLSIDLYKEFSTDDLKNSFILRSNNLTLGLIRMHDSLSDNPETNCTTISAKPLIIDSFMIHPNWWNQHAGDYLLKFAEEYAKTNGFTSLYLTSFSENQQAILFYEQFSFKQTGEFLARFQNIPFFCFEKILQ